MCQLVNHRSMGACDAFGLAASMFQGFCVREGYVYIVNSSNIEVILIFRYVRPCIYKGFFYCRADVSLQDSSARMLLLTLL